VREWDWQTLAGISAAGMNFHGLGIHSIFQFVKFIRNAFFLLFWLVLAKHGAAEVSAYSVDREVRLLSKVNMVNFGGMGMYRTMSPGELLLRRILKKEEAIKYLMEAYNSGTPAAKVYALAYFHHSAPEHFQICWDDIVGKYNPVVKSSVGCLIIEGSLFEHMLRIREGEYDPYVERAVRQAERSSRK
jgi:hypothetical protein